MQKKTRTPCVGICSTTYGDEVCRGCKRFYFEVINWNKYDENEKDAMDFYMNGKSISTRKKSPSKKIKNQESKFNSKDDEKFKKAVGEPCIKK